MFEPRPVHPDRPGLWLPARLDPTGETGPTRSEAQGRRVRRTSRGWYLPVEVTDETPEQRIVEASVLLAPGTAIHGWASLCWQGARWFRGVDAQGRRRPVTLVVGTHDLRPRPGIEVSAEGLNPAVVRDVDGVAVVEPCYAVSYLMRYAATAEAAAIVLDMAAYDDLVSVAEMTDYLGHQRGWTGVPRARKALGLAVENSWSPAESALGHVWASTPGLPTPRHNAPVFDLQGRHLGTPDLIDPTTGVCAEYDGEVHLEKGRRHGDVRRAGRLAAHGLEAVVAMAPDLRQPTDFVRELHEARRRAAARPASERRWTLTPPRGWVPTETVEQRRALTASQRERLLRYRRAS